MKELIDKSAIVAEIERKIRTEQGYSSEDAECGYRDCAKEILSFLDTLETKEVDLKKGEEKLNKTIKLADAMYNAAQRLTTDASKLHKAMQDWWNFKNLEL